ncbi:MAG: hypothetical protein QW186_08185 [Candidatus Bathyarchaeia archaeon]
MHEPASLTLNKVLEKLEELRGVLSSGQNPRQRRLTRCNYAVIVT